MTFLWAIIHMNRIFDGSLQDIKKRLKLQKFVKELSKAA